jgi:hypothetical protein
MRIPGEATAEARAHSREAVVALKKKKIEKKS